MGVAPHSGGAFTITRTKIILAVSVAITWWLAHLFPHYQPMLQAGFKSRLEEARQRIPRVKVDWHQEVNPRAAYNQSKVALIIEPRPIPHLVSQMLHMIAVVPPDWRFMFIGSEKSVLSLGRSFAMKHQQIIGKLDLMVLPEPWQIDTKERVYRMLTDMRFYDEFMPGVEWILKYESDSILCANAKSSLNDWLDWSWAGAPRAPDDRFAGNGGLSLRRVSAIKRVLTFQARYNDSEAEDEWYGKRLWVLPGEKVASGLHGALAVEDVYMENAMGFHVRDGGNKLPEKVWKSHEQRKKIFEYCPELSLIMQMKLERERCEGDDEEGTLHPTKVDKEGEREKQKEASRINEERMRFAMERQQAAKEAAMKAKAEQTYASQAEADGGDESEEDEAPDSEATVPGDGQDASSAEPKNYDWHKTPHWEESTSDDEDDGDHGVLLGIEEVSEAPEDQASYVEGQKPHLAESGANEGHGDEGQEPHIYDSTKLDGYRKMAPSSLDQPSSDASEDTSTSSTPELYPAKPWEANNDDPAAA